MRKSILYVCAATAFGAILTVNLSAEEKPLDYKLDDYRNFFCTWPDRPADALAYARNMGYSHVSYLAGMENLRASDGLYFMLETPEYGTYKQRIDMGKKYSEKEIAEWEDLCAMKDASKPFPQNMATGWFYGLHTVDGQPNFNDVSLQLNFQKQKVIDRTVDIIYKKAAAIMKKNPKFKLGGCVWDVPEPTGDFYGFRKGAKRPGQVKIEFWTGKDSVSVPEGVKLDYATYSEGATQYRRQLRAVCKKLNPDAKFIMDPWNLYTNYVEHVEKLKLPKDDPSLADMLMCESPDIKNFTDERIYKSGYIDSARVGASSDWCSYNFKKDIENIGTAAKMGAWSNWYGMPGPMGMSIRDVPPRLKLTHAIATWENLNHTPLSQRMWNPSTFTYDSPTAHMSLDAVWAMQPQTNKLFFVILSPDAAVKVPEGYDVEKFYVLDSLFGEYKPPYTKWKLSDIFEVKDGLIRIKADAKYVCSEGFVARLKKIGEKSE